jgi:hypothetical protein
MAQSSRMQLFTFGYFGWGNSTPQLVQAVDAVERSRGFKPPLFVDIRIRRAVRAAGFNGNAFGELLGDNRHHWIKALGNKQIETRSGPRIQIAKPSAVNELLDLAIEAAEDHRRLIFFCSCEFPRCDGRVNCHRTTVAALAITAAKRRGLNIEIVEWPGGNPSRLDLTIDSKSFNDLLRGMFNLPTASMALRNSAAIAWGSTATISADGQRVNAVIGPAQFRRRAWQLPVFVCGKGYTLPEIRREAAKVRRAYGFEALLA